MKRADARPVIPTLTDDTDMPELRMSESAGRAPGDDQTHAHAGADGDVGEITESSCGAPTSLSQCSALLANYRVQAAALLALTACIVFAFW
jgi:hypothetical protein